MRAWQHLKAPACPVSEQWFYDFMNNEQWFYGVDIYRVPCIYPIWYIQGTLYISDPVWIGYVQGTTLNLYNNILCYQITLWYHVFRYSRSYFTRHTWIRRCAAAIDWARESKRGDMGDGSESGEKSTQFFMTSPGTYARRIFAW
jgi:hypothetical protein